MAEEELHITPAQSAVSVGETLTIKIDSGPKFKNSTEVIIVVFEKGKQATPMVTFKGKLADNKFTKSEDPKVQSIPGAKDKIKVVLDPSDEPEVEVPLSGKGVHELNVAIQSKQPRQKSFTSPILVFARAFVRGTRPIIAFISGSESDLFFKNASAFWKAPNQADHVVEQKGISLRELLEQLETLGKRFGPWGTVNIVAHGFPFQIQMLLFPTSKLPLHKDKITEEIDAFTNGGGTWPRPDTIDAETKVIFRSCNAGQDKPLVQELKDSVFPDAKFVKIPKWLQFYRTGSGVFEEFFQEELLYDRPTEAKARADEATELPKQFDLLKLISPGLEASATSAAEVPTFAERKFTTGEFSQTSKVGEKDTIDPSTLSPLSDTTLIARYRAAWSPDFENDKKSATNRTPDSRWEIKLTKTQLKATAGESAADKQTREQLEGVWFESAAASPKMHQFVSGGVVLGSNVSGAGAMTIDGNDIDGFHATIDIEPNDKIKVEFKPTRNPDAADVMVGSTRLNAGNTSGTFSLPKTITIGAVTLTVRKGKAFALKFDSTRSFRHARRDMKRFVAGKAYADRPDLVQPNPDDPKHFETSS